MTSTSGVVMGADLNPAEWPCETCNHLARYHGDDGTVGRGTMCYVDRCECTGWSGAASAFAEATHARIHLRLYIALDELASVAAVIARITPEGDRIDPPDESWHSLDDALEQAYVALGDEPRAAR